MRTTFTEEQLDEIADQLTQNGYLVLKDIIDVKLLIRLQKQAQSLTQEHWRDAGIGRFDGHQVDLNIRGDKIHWIDGNTPAQRIFLDLMDSLRLGLDRRLFLGLYDFESHFSIYPKGMLYKTHIDALKGKSNRVLSTVLYLNSDWQESDGGQLLIHDENNSCTLATVFPNLGHMTIFLSEKFPHQVLSAQQQRYSIAGWFRVNNNQSGIIDPAS